MMPFYAIWGEELDENNEYRKRVEIGIDESRFVKIVTTANGYAILLDGDVIEIVSSNPDYHTEVIVRALRRASIGENSVGCSNPYVGDCVVCE